MKTFRVKLPESLHKQVRALAKQGGVSVDQFVTTALAEKLSALSTKEYLEARAARSDRGAFEQALASVPDADPEARDRL